MRPGSERMWTAAAALCGALLATAPALAREVYDDLYFVKPQASAAGLFQDRAECRREAQGQGGAAQAYSNPEYGAVSAMGSALDEDALFYALSRGIPEAQARALLIGAFLGEVVERIAHEGARALARAWLEARLGTPA